MKDMKDITPDIREVVRVLRKHWNTVDSGDGRRFLPEPTIIIQVDARGLWGDVFAVRETLVRAGVNMEREGVKVQGSCEWPDYEKGLVLVLGVINDNLGECPKNMDD